MASSRNGSGMKILWIPGRKRHDRKGIYKPTNKEVNKNYIQQRKNEMWSLGGASEQRKLINISVHDETTGAACSTMATHIVDPMCLAAGTTVAASAIKDNPSDDKLNLDENSSEKEKIVDKDILKNGEMNGDAKACNTDNIDIEDHAYHNAGTMRFRNNKKTGSNNTDLDSIEHLEFDEDENGKKHDILDDDIDSVSMHRMKSANVPSRRRRKANKKNKEFEDGKKKEEKIVDCLYFGLMCCECTIS